MEGMTGEATAAQVSLLLTGAMELVAQARDLAGVAEGAAGGDSAAWVQVAGACARLEAVVESTQLVAMARVAATEEGEHEDPDTGRLVEVCRGVGHLRLDSPDLLAPALGCTPRFAETRVMDAVRVATHLPVAGQWLADGLLTAFSLRTLVRATAELDQDQAARVLSRVQPWVAAHPAAPAHRLRVQVTRAIAAVAADALVADLLRVTGDRCLTRWDDGTCGQTWKALLPNGEADAAWEAIDARARELRRAGSAATLDQARADALVELVLANVDLRVVVNVAVPRDDVARGSAAPTMTTSVAAATTGSTVTSASLSSSTSLTTVTGLGSRPTTVPTAWVGELLSRPTTRLRAVACDPVTGALLDPPPGSDQHDPSAALRRWVQARDGTCRWPGCDIVATRCDLDHVKPWDPDPAVRDRTGGHTGAGNLLCLCRHHHRVKQRDGWQLTLHPDGRASVTDPHDRSTTTHPVDHRRLGSRPVAPPPVPAPLVALDDDTAHEAAARRSQLRTDRREDLALAFRHGLPLPLTDRHGYAGTTARIHETHLRHWRRVLIRAHTISDLEMALGLPPQPPPF